VKFKGFLANRNGVPSIVPPIIAGHIISICSQEVYDATFAFVTPLCANNDVEGHREPPVNNLKDIFEWVRKLTTKRNCSK
jgi:hypothetical protein